MNNIIEKLDEVGFCSACGENAELNLCIISADLLQIKRRNKNV